MKVIIDSAYVALDCNIPSIKHDLSKPSLQVMDDIAKGLEMHTNVTDE